MNRITLYSYNAINIEDILEVVNDTMKVVTAGEIISILKDDKNMEEEIFQYKYIDLTLLMMGDYERVDSWIQSMILIAQGYLECKSKGVTFIIDKRYARNICINLPYFFAGTFSLEKQLGLDQRVITNIVDITDERVHELENYFTNNLFGNEKFKRRLFEEIFRFRNFNRMGERSIFSVFLCGPSGIGKTETARLLHNWLANGERFIKISLGNYSEQNALSSLIGSPRGYIGSSKGELTDKIETSKSKIILIDEFEKASVEVHNFFLELLSDGRFTDSLGREYDLNKFIIIFTSNVDRKDMLEKISPELRSRFDLKYQMIMLNQEEKIKYLIYKSNYYLDKVKETFSLTPDSEELKAIRDIGVYNMNNLRDINRKLENNVSKFIDHKKSKIQRSLNSNV